VKEQELAEKAAALKEASSKIENFQLEKSLYRYFSTDLHLESCT
jgi:hypothetical protein